MTPETRRKLYKWICLGAMMFVCVILQTTVLSRMRVLGSSPSLIPFIVAAIALWEGAEDGMLAGLIGGVMLDAIYSGYEGFYVIVLTLLAFLICIMNKFMYWKNYGMSLLDWFIMILFTHFFRYCLYMLLAGDGSIISLLYILPGEVITTLPLTPFLYLITSKIIKHFDRIDDFWI